MRIVEQTELFAVQRSRIIDLWNDEYPMTLVYSTVSSFDEYLEKLANKRHFMLLDPAGTIVGWAMTFDREDARWFAIIIDRNVQGRGFGTLLMDRLKETENKLFGWVIDHNRSNKLSGEKYISPLGFYRKAGFRVCPDMRIESDKMSGVMIEWTASTAPSPDQ